jgi:hypothetical protein
LIRRYREANGCSEPPPRVIQVPDKQRTASYLLEDVREDASVLLYQVRQKIKQSQRIEIQAPPLLILARKRGLFLMYFCGLHRGKPVWCYGSEHLAQPFKFNEAEEITAQLGEGVYALPAPESSKRGRTF